MNINPRQMQKMMQRLGMQQQEIDAKEVIIKTADKEIVFSNPSVSKINVMGQDTWQIVGTPVERTPVNKEDINTVMKQADVDEKTASQALEESNGDLAEAILKLKA